MLMWQSFMFIENFLVMIPSLEDGGVIAFFCWRVLNQTTKTGTRTQTTRMATIPPTKVGDILESPEGMGMGVWSAYIVSRVALGADRTLMLQSHGTDEERRKMVG